MRQGWIGNASPPVDGFELGSLLWVTEPGKTTQSTVNLAASFARQSLQWMIDQGIADTIDVAGVLLGPRRGQIQVTVNTKSGQTESEFIELWENTVFVAQGLPAPIVDEPPFDLLSVAGLSSWIDADISEHVQDSACGVITAGDITGTADFSQGNAARRPLRLLGAGGWLYRFDGVDDFLATANTILQNYNQGSCFFVLRPAASVTVDDVIFALGINGFTDAVRGLKVVQRAGNVLRLSGDGGNLEIDIQGSANSDPSIGVVMRWGSAAAGANAETSTLQAEADSSFTNDIGAPNQIVIGAGFDGAGPDVATAAALDLKLFGLWDRRVPDLDLTDLLDYSFVRSFTSPVGEQFSDCSFFTDDQGLVDG